MLKRGNVYMIIRFSVKNFRSYKEENTLNFVSSSKITTYPDHEKKFGRLSVVKNIGIFGSNAFGKSNILNALGAMVNLVVRGSCHENIGFIDNPEEPTKFDLVFITDDKKIYEYTYTIKKENVLNPFVVLNEDLYQLFLNGSSKVIYSRNNGGLCDNDSEALRIFAQGYQNINGQLFLRYINAPERFVPDNEISVLLRKIFKFFVSNVFVTLDNDPMLFLINKENIPSITNYLKKYDIGIKEVGFVGLLPNEIESITRDPIFNMIKKEFQEHSSLKDQYFTNGKEIFNISRSENDFVFQKLVFRHKGVKNDFCFGYESNGTQRIFTLLALLFDKKNTNTTIVVDEIEKSAFTTVIEELIKDFQKEFKDTNTQLVFTSHLHSLFDAVLRRDEIYFVDKNSNGESYLYSLSDFKTKTRDNVTKEFLDGSFGAIPKIGVELKYDGSSN